MSDEPKSTIQEEKRRILEMLARKQISAREADELIAVLEEGEQVQLAHRRTAQEIVCEPNWLGDLVNGVVRFTIKGTFGRRPGPRWP